MLWSVLVNRLGKLWILGVVLTLAAGVSCTAGELPMENQNAITPSGGGVAPSDSTQSLTPDTTVAPADTAGSEPGDSSVATPIDTTTADTTIITPVDSSGPDLWDGTLLSCRPQPYAVTTMVVGPKGGLILFGNHALKIFEGALTENVTITAEQVEGTVNSVRFSPEGLRFAVPAVLSLSYKNCENVRHWKSIVYTDESLNILEPTLSYDFSNSSQVKGLIYHFSRYAVAY
jgi:hypothetical protein